MAAADPLLTPAQVGLDLGLSVRTLANKRSNPERYGPGPRYVKVGRLVRYQRSAIDRWIEQNTHDCTPVPELTRRRRAS